MEQNRGWKSREEVAKVGRGNEERQKKKRLKVKRNYYAWSGRY